MTSRPHTAHTAHTTHTAHTAHAQSSGTRAPFARTPAVRTRCASKGAATRTWCGSATCRPASYTRWTMRTRASLIGWTSRIQVVRDPLRGQRRVTRLTLGALRAALRERGRPAPISSLAELFQRIRALTVRRRGELAPSDPLERHRGRNAAQRLRRSRAQSNGGFVGRLDRQALRREKWIRTSTRNE